MKMEDLPVIGKVTGAQFFGQEQREKENCFTQMRALSFNLPGRLSQREPFAT